MFYPTERINLKNETVMEALISGNEVVIRDVLAKLEGLRVHDICQNGTTLACAAVKTGSFDILKIILGVKSPNSESPESEKRVRKTDLNTEFPDPLSFGCYNRTTFEATRKSDDTYITLGKIFHLDKFGKNVLHYAVLWNDVEMVEFLLTHYKELRSDQVDISLNSPLHIAVSRDNLEMVKLLLNFGAPVDSKDCEGKTPLHIASERGSTDIVTFLLDANANINALDYTGQSTLMLASMYDHCSTVELLIRKGVKINYEDDEGFTALRRAVYIKNPRVTKILVENGARIVESQNLVHYGIIFEQFEIVKILLDGGARLEAQNYHGYTPLMVAVEQHDLEITKYLLEKGADPNAINWINGTTSLHLSMFVPLKPEVTIEFLNVLIKHGADFYVRTKYGIDALYYAFYHKNDIAACHLVKMGMNVNFRNTGHSDYLSASVRLAVTVAPVKMILMAGFDMKKFEDRGDYHKCVKRKTLSDKQKVVYDHLRTVFTLKEYCRTRIRRMCKYEDLAKLPIPRTLHQFLRLENVDICNL